MSEFEAKLASDVREVFRISWNETKGQVVPESKDLGLWVMHSVYDDKSCEKCGSSCSLIEVDEATGMEIQAFAMVNEEDGSRQAQEGETPAFYDVMVTTNPTSEGEIHTMQELDDLNHAQMLKAIAKMQDTYPLAPVTCHFREEVQ